jgi:hypothetical protein
MRLGRSPGAWQATLLYAIAAAALTWPLVPRAARDVPGDLLDPLFTCWALGWNFHAFGLSAGGPPLRSYWDANIFHPTPHALARSEHFFVQALQGAPVYALTGNLILTYNVLFLATFVLSGTFLYLAARAYTADRWAALGAGLLYAFALYRWVQVGHLGALSSQWMPLALLLTHRVAVGGKAQAAAAAVVALGAVTAAQVASSGYYLLFFPPFLAMWGAMEAARAGGRGPWLRLGAAAALAVVLSLPMVLPYVALHAGGAQRDLASVVAHSADLLSLVTAPDVTPLWGTRLAAFPRGEARLFPGVVLPLLICVALVHASRAVRGQLAPADTAGQWPPRVRRLARPAATVCAVLAVIGALAAVVVEGTVRLGSLELRVTTLTRPAFLLTLALVAATIGWPRLNAYVRGLAGRREVVAALLAALAVALALGPLVTLRGRPTPLPALYRPIYEGVPGFGAGRAPARFAMVAACFAALAAGWGLHRLRQAPRGRLAALALCLVFLAETAPAGLPLSRQWEVEDVAALPPWYGGKASPIVFAIRALPPEAVLAILPFDEIFHETRAMFDSTYHWRRLVNGYSSWTPLEHTRLAFAVRDPLRQAPEVVAALRAAGATHVVVHEAAWRRDKGARVTERLIEAGAREVARAGDVVLLALR